MGTEVWEAPTFSSVVQDMRKAEFKEGERRTREAGRETVAVSGNAKKTTPVGILRSKRGSNGAESYLEARQDGDGKGTAEFAKLRGRPGLHSIFRGVVGVGARLLWAEECVGGEDRAGSLSTYSFKKYDSGGEGKGEDGGRKGFLGRWRLGET